AVFEFPEVKEGAITTQESENVTFHFTVIKTNCGDDDFEDFNIDITKVGKDGNAATYCSIRHRNGTCTNADRGCTCPGDDGSYQWSKTVDRKDNAKWVWHTTNKMTTKEEVLINVVCLDVLENIPRNLTVMAGQSENLIVGVVSHAQLESMFCKLDSGEKTCGRFPVRCKIYFQQRQRFPPPEIKIKTPEIEFVPGEDVKIEINVCTHTNDLLSCQLTMLSDSEKSPKTRRRPLPQRPDRVLFQQSDNASMDPDNLNLYQEIDNDSRQRPADVPGQPNDYLELIGLPSEVEENQSEGPTHRIQTDEDGYLRPSARD
ncbi:hypothetical protein BaRGS_00035230, partial [Batillaria attramentaria]